MTKSTQPPAAAALSKSKSKSTPLNVQTVSDKLQYWKESVEALERSKALNSTQLPHNYHTQPQAQQQKKKGKGEMLFGRPVGEVEFERDVSSEMRMRGGDFERDIGLGGRGGVRGNMGVVGGGDGMLWGRERRERMGEFDMDRDVRGRF